MSIATPATITYDNENGASRTLRSHTVISEEHTAQSEITKFPVQTGYVISNHAIRKNRKVSIEGMISNILMKDDGNTVYSSVNNSKVVYNILNSLVTSSTTCTVNTNLGIYKPVVFNRFSTKQSAGLVDAMIFKMEGEELQLKNSLNKTGPKELDFTENNEADNQAVLDSMKASGLPYVYDVMVTSTSQVNLGTSFKIVGTNAVGDTVTTTMEYVSYDASTGRYIYSQHSTETKSPIEIPVIEVLSIESVSSPDPSVTGIPKKPDIGVLGEQEDIIDITLYNPDMLTADHFFITDPPDYIPDPEVDSSIDWGRMDLQERKDAAVSTTGACALEGFKDFVGDQLDNLTNTALGIMEETAFGVRHKITSLYKDSPLAPLVTSLLECTVAGVVAGVANTDISSTYDTSIPDSEDALDAAKEIGLSAGGNTTRILSPMTIHKMPALAQGNLGNINLPTGGFNV